MKDDKIDFDKFETFAKLTGLPKINLNLPDIRPIQPNDIFKNTFDVSEFYKKIDMPEPQQIGNVFEDIINRQDQQLEKQNQVIENQNQQIIELQNLSAKKDEEIEELKTINNKKDAEFMEAQKSAKTERKKWWFTTILAILAFLVSIAGIIVSVA